MNDEAIERKFDIISDKLERTVAELRHANDQIDALRTSAALQVASLRAMLDLARAVVGVVIVPLARRYGAISPGDADKFKNL